MNILIVGNGRAGSRWGRLAHKLDHAVSFSDTLPERNEASFTPDAVQAIIIATPAEEHFAAAWACHQLWPRVPMLVEKPLDVSLDHADEWRQIKPWYVNQWRYAQMVDRVRECALPLLHLTLKYANARDGDAITESAIHDFDLACWLRCAELELRTAEMYRSMAILSLAKGSWMRTTIMVNHSCGPRERIVSIEQASGPPLLCTDASDDPDVPYRRILADFLSPAPSATLPTVDDGLRALRLALQAKDMLADA